MTRRSLTLLALVSLRLLISDSRPQESTSAQTAKLISEQPGKRPASLDRDWPAVLTHTHHWRFSAGENPGSFDEAEDKLVAWCRNLHIRAVGVGSAWNPAVEANFQRFEGPDRDLYYSGKFDQKSVMDVAGVNKTLQDLNTRSAGKTLFYLDNETPKTRFGHMWWFGYRYDYPAWHDYSQDRPIKFFERDSSVEINSLTGEPHTRRNLFEIMATQRKSGAVGIFAHPTRWWISNGQFITNIAAMSGLFLLADGYLDGLAVMGDRVYNKSYQDLWFTFLDTGAKVPGFAETDFFLNQVSRHSGLDSFRNYPHIGARTITEKAIRDVARAGDVFASNGAFLNTTIDGIPMGSVCRTAAGKRHKLRIEVYPEPESGLGRIEIVSKHGAVLLAKNDFPGGVLEFEIPGSDQPTYIVVRVFGSDDDAQKAPDQVKHLAVSNPIYLWPSGFALRRASTVCTLHVAADSRWKGGSAEFQESGGLLIERRLIQPGTISVTVPASVRVVLRKSGLNTRMFYIAMENVEVERNLSYLVSGEFRNDYPDLPSGEVPPEAFHLPQLREALRAFEYDLK